MQKWPTNTWLSTDVFTARNGARLYFHRRVWFCSHGGWGAWFRGVPGGDPPGRLLLRTVRILLECILVVNGCLPPWHIYLLLHEIIKCFERHYWYQWLTNFKTLKLNDKFQCWSTMLCRVCVCVSPKWNSPNEESVYQPDQRWMQMCRICHRHLFMKTQLVLLFYSVMLHLALKNWTSVLFCAAAGSFV